MSRRLIVLIVAAVALASAVIAYLASKGTMSVLEPAGPIAEQQKDIMGFALLLCVIIVVPVFGLTFFIIWKYRASNHRGKYQPEWDGSRILETLWWVIPGIIITILAVTAYRTSHSLDPIVPISSNQKPLNVQVVAMTWKWLFIYPEQGIATVNQLNIPTDRPIHFDITADAPMNSFWIPQLGGQIYAMPGMSTQLNLLADREGKYRGSSANISGTGFSSMVFETHATSPSEFNAWITQTQHGENQLDKSEYQQLAKPNTSKTRVYSSVDANLYKDILDKYMGHSHTEKTE